MIACIRTFFQGKTQITEKNQMRQIFIDCLIFVIVFFVAYLFNPHNCGYKMANQKY